MMTVQCCKCKRIRNGALWVAPDPAPEGPVSHTYCPSCYLESCLEFFSAEASRACSASAAALSQIIQDV